MLNYVPGPISLVQSLNLHLQLVSARLNMLFGPYSRGTELHPNGSTDAVLDRFAVLNHAPTIAVQSCVYDRTILAPTRSSAEGFDLKVARQAEAFRQLHLCRAMVQKNRVLLFKKTAATPAIAF